MARVVAGQEAGVLLFHAPDLVALGRNVGRVRRHGPVLAQRDGLLILEPPTV